MEDIRTTVQDVIQQEITPVLLKMLSDSDARIDRTNEMIKQLSDACKDMMSIYDKHLTSLEKSRDALIDNNCSLVQNNGTLLKEVEHLRKELLEAKRDYHKLFDSFLLMSNTKQATSTTEVSVTR